MRKDDQTLLTETAKANALNDQFQSVFSPKTPISLKSLAQKSLQDLHDSGASPSFQPSPYPKMPDISIAAEGIDKLLVGLNTHKAAGPDKFKPIVLQIIMKSLDPLRAKKIFIRKKLGHTAVSAIKASSVTLQTWQKEPVENTVNLQF